MNNIIDTLYKNIIKLYSMFIFSYVSADEFLMNKVHLKFVTFKKNNGKL